MGLGTGWIASLRTEGGCLRGRTRDALHVFVLASFAIAQPAYDRIGQRGFFLADQEIGGSAILLVVFAVSIGLPAILLLLEALAGCFSAKAYEAVHAIVVFVLSALFALTVGRKLEFLLSGLTILALALGGAATLAWSYFSFSRVRTLIEWSAPGILVFPGSLLLASSVTGILFPPGRIQTTRWSPVPVVVVVFDEFCGSSLMTPERQIDAHRFPNFAELSRLSTWYRNASSVHAETCHALPAILSGKYATTDWPPVLADRPQNLFSAVESTGGFELAVFEPFSNLAAVRENERSGEPVPLRRQVAVLADTFWRVYLFQVVPSEYWRSLPRVSRGWFGVRETSKIDPTKRRGVFRYDWTSSREEPFEHFLRCVGATPNPTLHFVHLVLPHIPWCHAPSGRRYVRDDDPLDLLSMPVGLLHRWGMDELFVQHAHQRYLLQLQFVDGLIGKLLTRLRETNLLDESLLIVTGDHGVSFRTGLPRRDAVPENIADIASVPLFIKRPQQTRGAISDMAVESVDILPTIADVLGIELREPTDGWSVFDDARPARDQVTIRSRSVDSKVPLEVLGRSDVPTRIRDIFGASHDPSALFRIGPGAELVGRRVDSVEVSEGLPVVLELLRNEDFPDTGAESLVPCLFEGVMRSPGDLSVSPAIAVAVNGTIQAVTTTYSMACCRNRWAAIVPEWSFRPGRNDVRFYVVTGAFGSRQLSTCTVLPPPERHSSQ